MIKPSNLFGLHKLLSLKVKDSESLTNLENYVKFTDALLLDYGLEKVGLSFHEFENRSFTAAYCLKESHICIHTWPEVNSLTLDIYLCNYSQDNTEKVLGLANDFVRFFNAEIVKEFEISR